jgi:hypothetical protein
MYRVSPDIGIAAPGVTRGIGISVEKARKPMRELIEKQSEATSNHEQASGDRSRRRVG